MASCKSGLELAEAKQAAGETRERELQRRVASLETKASNDGEQIRRLAASNADLRERLGDALLVADEARSEALEGAGRPVTATTSIGDWRLTNNDDGVSYTVQTGEGATLSGQVPPDALDALITPPQSELAATVNELGGQATAAEINDALGRKVSWQELRRELDRLDTNPVTYRARQ